MILIQNLPLLKVSSIKEKQVMVPPNASIRKVSKVILSWLNESKHIESYHSHRIVHVPYKQLNKADGGIRSYSGGRVLIHAIPKSFSTEGALKKNIGETNTIM